MYKVLITGLVLLMTDTKLLSQQRMGLDSILARIEQNHPVTKMYAAQIRSADEAAKGATSWDAPELGTGFWMTPYDPALWKQGMGQYMVSVQQMIPNRKEQQANQKYMQAMSGADHEREQASMNELYATAKTAYFEWLINEKKLDVLKEDDQLLDFMVRSAELRYKNGMGKLNVYYKVKAAIGSLESQRIMVENEIAERRIMLNTLMNRDREEPFVIDTALALKEVKEYAAVDTAYLMQARSDIRAVDREIDLTHLQGELEKSKLKPRFGVQYDHMFGFGSLPMQFSLMATMKWPLAAWSAKSYKANIESLEWKAAALRQQKELLANEARGQTVSLQTAIRNKKKQLDLYDNMIIPALKKNLQTMQLGYEQNTEDLFELFDAWQSLNSTRMDYLDQLQTLLTLQVQLEKVLEKK